MSYSVFRRKVPGFMRRLMNDIPSWDAVDVAACFGNAGHESGGLTKLQEIAPTVKGSKGGYGWFQWTGPRRRAFEAWCKANGLKPSDDEANYRYLVVELRGPEKAAVAAVNRAKSLHAKVKAFELAFERAGIKHYDSRNKWAEIALEAYNKDADDAPLPPDIKPVEKPTPTPTPKPLTKSKTMWGGIGQFVTGSIGAVIAFVQGLPPWLIALIVVALLIGLFLVIKGRIDVQKVVKQLSGD